MSNRYSPSFKETMVSKLVGPGARSATSLSNEIGIPQSTLSRWLRQYGQTPGETMSNKSRSRKRTVEEKFQAVVEYDNQPDEQSRGRFLRERGLYSSEIERWRSEMLGGLSSRTNQKDSRDQRIKDLERELNRKEKALAETAALLTLKKTAQQIWGGTEGEK